MISHLIVSKAASCSVTPVLKSTRLERLLLVLKAPDVGTVGLTGMTLFGAGITGIR